MPRNKAHVETATYGSEYVAAQICVDQIVNLRYSLRMLGVPLDGPSWMFGDNQSVITSSTVPHSALNKRHNALAYHRVQEAIAAGFVKFNFVAGKYNPADILTKPINWAMFWPIIQPMLFWKGDTFKAVVSSEPVDQTIEHICEGQGEHPSYTYHQDVAHARVRGVTNCPPKNGQKGAGISRFKPVKVVKITKVDRAKVREVTPVVGPS